MISRDGVFFLYQPFLKIGRFRKKVLLSEPLLEIDF